MYKISEIISLPIISLYESEFQGTIFNIIFDQKSKKCTYICILNEEDDIEKVVNINDIHLIGNNCVFIKNGNYIELKSNIDNITSIPLIHLPVYNLNGNYIGKCVDIELDNKYCINKIILDNSTTIDVKKIINIGKTIILTNDTIVNINKYKNKCHSIHIKKTNNKVIILSENQNLKVLEENTIQKNSINTKNKIITDSKFLTGRTLYQDIKTFNGEIILRKGTNISKETINKASLYGKLMELARYSK